ncbi:MAG: type II toxin-antitoxin system RelE/ParE family toxin [Xanthobacteraceae bacterium]
MGLHRCGFAAAADAFVWQITGKFEPLRQFPELGAAREQLAPGLRALPYRNYVIYYLAEADELVIVRVLHGAHRMHGRYSAGDRTPPRFLRLKPKR